MKKSLIIILLLAIFCIRGAAYNRGIPFIRNFTAKDYNAHNRNYDIACDGNGTVFVANFEGLLYYDGCTWRKIHTPGVSRVTRVARGTDGKIWVGGHKVFGYVSADEHGILRMHSLVSDKSAPAFEEVDMIKITPTRIFVHTSDGKAYYVKGNKQLIPLRAIKPQDVVNSANDSIFNLQLGRLNVSTPKNNGLIFRVEGRERNITEADGLCSNIVNFITYDKTSTLWGATEHGVFAIEIPSPYSHLTEAQGLRGDVYSIQQLEKTLFVGTLQGLYSLNSGKLTKIENINYACWQLLPTQGNALMAATSGGLWKVTLGGARQLTDANTLSVSNDGKGGYYTGELDGLYRVSASGQRTLIARIEKVTHITDIGRELKVETIFGEVWNVDKNNIDKRTLVRRSEDVLEPKLEITDALGRKWVTDFEGKDLSLISRDQSAEDIAKWTKPLGEKTLNAVFCNEKNSLWVGGDFGIINCNLAMLPNIKSYSKKDDIYIRQVLTAGDSILWGGYTQKDMSPVRTVKDIEISSSARSITIRYSTRRNPIFSPTKYRYRLNNGHWTKWSLQTEARFTNIASGDYVFEVQALDQLGNISETATVQIYIEYPLYLRWWSLLSYLIILLIVIRMAIAYREEKLQKAKDELEAVVNKRTAELSERTSELSTALDDLQRTQADLVRMERTATAGKLTQGLIDRILNPINYINNFAKLTRGLAKDLGEDIEDEQENMTEDNYEDCQDILDMMKQNLSKIEEHGVNTTRTLRAMEAMLNSHIGTLRNTDMNALVKQAVSVASEYHKEAVKECNISMITKLPDDIIMHEVDPDSINNVLLALLTNAIYAVTKKYQRAAYGAEVVVKLSKIDDKRINIHIADNGIGIEDTIIDKVFDPFFTTKPTGEASGVGLYLAREIVQDHNGTILLKSEKDQYTELTINL